MILYINSDAAVAFTNKLEKLHRSALPIAIRGTLNKAAFDVKQNTMPKSADRTFIRRQPNFFKANSHVQMATGFDVPLMKSIVGFTPQSLRGANNYSVAELEQQEYGGKIEKRTFIPLDEARVGNSSRKIVRPINRLSAINKIINSNTSNSNSSKAKFIKAAFAAGKGGFVIGNLGKKKLYRIEDIGKEGGKLKLKTEALYSFDLGRNVRVNKTGFMANASTETAEKLYIFYAQEAKRQIDKLMAGTGAIYKGKQNVRSSISVTSRSFLSRFFK